MKKDKFSKMSAKELEDIANPDAAAIRGMIDTARRFNAERLSDILGDLFEETLLSEGISDAEMVVDNIVWCLMDKQDETTELARTVHPFIVKAIIEGGKATNRYVVVVNPVR